MKKIQYCIQLNKMQCNRIQEQKYVEYFNASKDPIKVL